MHIKSSTFNGRPGWELHNGAVTMFVLAGGGHIAGLVIREQPTVNPLWTPIWKAREPWQYSAKDAKRYGEKLLACIAGHNICLNQFGTPSRAEMAAGMGSHGEAPVARWSAARTQSNKAGITFVYGCNLPIAGLRIDRAISMRKGSHVVRVTERIQNLLRRDQPFTMCEHVTFGPPFLTPGETLFDMPATLGATFPGPFGKPQRLKPNARFNWPNAPGARGKSVNLRTMGNAPNGDFSTQLMNPDHEHAWFSAVNPRLGVMVAYVWNRSDFPWVGNWEENKARKSNPWKGKSLTRGMEFANSPFPVGLTAAVTAGSFQGQPTFRWLPALETIEIKYAILSCPVGPTCRGVLRITPVNSDFRVDFAK